MPQLKKRSLAARVMATAAAVATLTCTTTTAFAPLPLVARGTTTRSHLPNSAPAAPRGLFASSRSNWEREQQQQQAIKTTTKPTNHWASVAAAGMLIASLVLAPMNAFAENELSDRYGGGLDTSLVDQTCLVNQCSVQAKACLADDPDCRKGLTCTAKCLGDNACITGCMARYGNDHLDDLLKCTIEDNECIKVAILPGGADVYGQEPRAPGPVVRNFNVASLQGSWYKVVGYNPNYDCYACQRNTFSSPTNNNKQQQPSLEMEVEFSMPHLLPDGSPPPPTGGRETILVSNNNNGGSFVGSQSIALNAYHTHETMVFDDASSSKSPLLSLASLRSRNHGDSSLSPQHDVSFARTAHSEGEMFGLKFWENWYIIGENDANAPDEFKFVYYNGKTRQNTYEGAFIYSRTQDLSPESMKKVYQIAKDAGMDPDQFCRIRNQGCFAEEEPQQLQQQGPTNSFRGILASTRVSQLLGVEPVAAQDTLRRGVPTAQVLNPPPVVDLAATSSKRAWWFEVGDYLENPHRHFEAMDSLRQPMRWPEEVVTTAGLMGEPSG